MKAKSERRRPFIGDQIDECRDASGLFYIFCFQKGYLTNWDVQVSLYQYNKLKQNFGTNHFVCLLELILEKRLGLCVQQRLLFDKFC